MAEDIPKGWRKEKLKEFAKVITGNTPPTSALDSYNGTYLWVTPTDINEKKDISNTNRKLTDKGINLARKLPQETLLITCIASIGKNVILKKEGSCNQQINAILPSEKYNTNFLYYWFENNKKLMRLLAGQTAVPIINKNTFENLSVVLPTLKEQEKISKILTTIDDDILETNNIIDNCERVKKGLMQMLLTKGIPGKHKKFKKTELGEIPEDWELLPLHKLLESCQYGIAKPLTVGKKGFPCLRMNNLFEGELDTSDLKYIELSEKEFENYRLFEGDILFNRTNSFDLVGKVCIFRGNEPMVFAGYLIRLKTNERMISEFLNIYMNSELGQGIIRRLITPGVSQANINATNLQRIPVPVPSINEQHKITDTIITINKKVKFENEKSLKLLLLKASLMQKLLSGEIRVRVD